MIWLALLFRFGSGDAAHLRDRPRFCSGVAQTETVPRTGLRLASHPPFCSGGSQAETVPRTVSSLASHPRFRSGVAQAETVPRTVSSLAQLVRAEGLEPPHLSIPGPKPGASTSSATPA